jgi:6-phosphogluconolactonase
MELTITKDIEELSHEAALWIRNHIERTLHEKDRFTMVLAGGNTPKKLYQILASVKFRDTIDWSKLDFFWGDERYVPFSDERNNAKMAFDTLLDEVPVNKSHIHPVATHLTPDQSATEYENILRGLFADNANTFDLVLLGLGDNAHTLSLFPGYGLTQEKKQWVKAFYLEEQKMHRITLTPPVVNAAANVMFLVSGKDKARALAQVLESEYNPELYPAQCIQPASGNLFWFVDNDAAAELE